MLKTARFYATVAALLLFALPGSASAADFKLDCADIAQIRLVSEEYPGIRGPGHLLLEFVIFPQGEAKLYGVQQNFIHDYVIFYVNDVEVLHMSPFYPVENFSTLWDQERFYSVDDAVDRAESICPGKLSNL